MNRTKAWGGLHVQLGLPCGFHSTKSQDRQRYSYRFHQLVIHISCIDWLYIMNNQLVDVVALRFQDSKRVLVFYSSPLIILNLVYV